MSEMNDVLIEDIKGISEYKGIHNLAGKTIMITGATGLIGSIFIKSLLYYNETHEQKINIIGLIRNTKKAEDIFKDFTKNNFFKLIKCDILNEIEIDDGIDFIVHTASVTTSKIFVTNPVETLDVLYKGTKNVLELAKKKTCKSVVYLSSMEMYGAPDQTLERVTESELGYIDILSVRSSYSEGKRIAECMCAAYADEYQVPVKIARLAQTFGAGVLSEDNRVYAQFARCAIKKENIVLHTEGKSNGNYCYTSDVIKALLLLLEKGKNGEAYNVCNDNTVTTIADMAHMVVDEFGNNEINVVYDIPEDSKTYGYAPTVKMHLSSKKLQELGWQPEFSLVAMYKRLIEYMKSEMK